MAQRSPSWCNTQPWHLRVLQGDVFAEVSAELMREAEANVEKPDIPFPMRFEGVYK